MGEVVREELAKAVRQFGSETSKSGASKRDQEAKGRPEVFGLKEEGLDGKAPLSPRALVDDDQLFPLAAD